MAGETKDNWSSEAYQHSASFVPKLATKITQWLDPQKDDVILDIGCGDGILTLQIQDVLFEGNGSIHGIDASPAMIEAAIKLAEEKNKSTEKTTKFEVLDALDLINTPHLQQSQYTKAFSNAALHWILRPAARRAQLFAGVRGALGPGGLFVFEMGGLGNVAEMRAALLMGVARRVGLERAAAFDPWFFPDEEWVKRVLEDEVGGWKVERAEREYRPTRADQGGVDGWVRLFGKQFFEAVEEGREREECVKEVVRVLEVVCRNPAGGFNLGYVRLRVVARKL